MQETISEMQHRIIPMSWAMATGKHLREEDKKPNGNISVEETTNQIRTDESNQDKKKISDSRPMSKEMTDELKRRRKKPTTFVIDPGPHTISDTIKRIKTGTDKNRVQDNITKIRATKNGGILVQVRGDQKTKEWVIEDVTKAAGTDAKLVDQKALIEIRDIDEWSTKNEIEDEISQKARLNSDLVKVISLRNSFGTQTALVLLPTHYAGLLAEKKHVTIGLVSCRIRLRGKNDRCYKCLAFGHESKTCPGPNRTKYCRRCGDEGHFIANCKAPDTVSAEFKQKLREEKSIKENRVSQKEAPSGPGRSPEPPE